MGWIQPVGHHLSQLPLLQGWFPWTVQIIAAAAVAAAIGFRNPRRRLGRLGAAVAVGVALALAVRWYIASQGLAGDPAPFTLWVWIVLAGAAVVLSVIGWRGAGWRRRAAAITAVPLCVLSVAVVLNLWTGYFPTLHAAWNQFTAGPLPDQTDWGTVTAMQQVGRMPATGTVVSVDVGHAASNFRHRNELVYLPPAWYTTDPPPMLPTMLMIGGEFNTPGDWLRAGNAVQTLDAFAAAHHGYAPVAVFVDAGGGFHNDTECVNGPRGNSADHLTKDVVPYVVSHFGVSPNRDHWGVVGFSMGGTCAVDLTVMHPDMFSVFEDIAGDLSPNTGTKAQTIARLFGGNEAAWAAFDPSTVITRHGRFTGVSGWFDVNQSSPATPNDQLSAAHTLCGLGAAHGIDCAVVTQPGNHDWLFAAQAFGAALPWLAGRLGTPDVAPATLPGAPPVPAARPVAVHPASLRGPR